MSKNVSNQENNRSAPETDDFMRIIADSVRPDKQAIRKGVERRLRDRMLRNNVLFKTNAPSSSFAYRRWASACIVFLAFLLAVYWLFDLTTAKNGHYIILPAGQIQLSNAGKTLTKVSSIDAEGETIKTLNGGGASLYQVNGYCVRIAPLSSLSVTDEDCVELKNGSLFAEVKKRSDTAKSFSVNAGDIKVYVLGTEFSVEKNNGRIEVAVRKGRVRVVAVENNKELILNAGESVAFHQGKIDEPSKIALERIAPWRQTLILAEKNNPILRDLMEKYFKSRTLK